MAACIVVLFLSVGKLSAHPHIFIDGGVDYIFDQQSRLSQVSVTWRYDAFETLYLLSELGVFPEPDTDFSDAEREKVEAELGDFPADFDGSVHIFDNGALLDLKWPRDLVARMVGDRLEVTFIRDLTEPKNVGFSELNVQFYERTYFFAFNLTDAPNFVGNQMECEGEIIPFKPSDKTDELKNVLAALSREEASTDQNVGALFADSMRVLCR